MEIILAAPRGFCAGVNMAVTSLDLAIAQFGTPIYVYHEIVHNQYVVKTFQSKGAVFVNELEEIPCRFDRALFRTRSCPRGSPGGSSG